MSEATTIRGQCLCGAVTVELRGPVGDLSACHCEMCTRWGGGLQMGMEVARDHAEVRGPVKTYQSSTFAERAWCDRCGSSLWLANTEGPDAGVLEFVPGLFEDFAGARLSRVVYADCAPRGFALAGDLERVSKADYEARFLHVEDRQ